MMFRQENRSVNQISSPSNVMADKLLEVVVTARPSWARVKSLLINYAHLFGEESVKITLAGSAISRNFGDVTLQVPAGIKFETVHTLQDSDDLTSISLSAFNLSSALVRSWASHRPDFVLVIADRTETLGVSSAAAISQIPLVHLQGGEISGSIDNKIRDANTKLSDLHLTTNEQTKLRLLSMGEEEESVHIVGCPSIDLVRSTLERKRHVDLSEIPGVGAKITQEKDFGIVMFHPDTLHESDNVEWLNLLIDFVQASDLYWFWFWPNPDHGTTNISKELRRRRELGAMKNVRFVINLEPEIFISIASLAKLIVGNSSFGIREASYLGLPALNIGKRQMNRQKGRNVLDIEELNDREKMADIFISRYRLKVGEDLTYGTGYAGEIAASILGAWSPKLKN